MAVKVHYGWYIVVVCMLMMFGASLVSTGLNAGLNELNNMGISERETSTIVFITSLMSFVSTIFANIYFNKLGLRNGMLLAVLSGAIAFIIYSFGGTNIIPYYVGAIFGGLTYGLGFTLSTSMIIRRWFNKSRGFALGMCSVGSAISIAVGTPILQSIISNVNLSTSFIVEAIFMFIVAILVIVIIRNDPSDMGLEPYGGITVEEREHKTKYSLNGTILFMMIIAAILLGTSAFPATSNLSHNFSVCGLDAMYVAFGISLFGIMLIFSKLVCGRVVDKFGALFATLIFGAFTIVGLMGCYLVSFIPEYAFMYVTFIILGIGYPISTLGYTNWASEFTTKEDYPKILRKFQLAFQLGILIGSPLPGLISEHTGNFCNAYLIFAVSVSTSIILVTISYAKARRI